MRKALLFLLCTGFCHLLLEPLALAHSGYLDQLRYSYRRPFRCSLCHVPSVLNTLGQDLAGLRPQAHTLRQSLKQWGAMDSDRDGFSNETELCVGTDPANPSDFPGQLSKSLRPNPRKP